MELLTKELDFSSHSSINIVLVLGMVDQVGRFLQGKRDVFGLERSFLFSARAWAIDVYR